MSVLRSTFLLLVLLGCSDGATCEGSLCDAEPESERLEETPSEGEGQRRPPREGPEGCYIGSRRQCDCDIPQAECTGEDQTWTDGCASCAG